MALALAVPFVIRLRCRTCTRSVDPREAYLDICAYCWLQRSLNMRYGFNINEFSSPAGQCCYECHNLLGGIGYLHWVVDAKTFALYCIPCSDRKWATDGQYKGTEFAYAQKIQ
ncbi:MAG: hypothetical protein ACREBG_15960 [Pyrinomonadaceae bacterium]